MKQLNRKTPLVMRVMLLLLIAVLVSSYAVGGLYARYTSTGTGTATAQAAVMDCAVSAVQSTYKDITINVDVPAVYAVVEEVMVENTGDVAFQYDLTLTGIEGDFKGTFAAPALNGAALKQIRVKDGTTGEIVNMNFGSVCGGKSYTANKVYYAYSTDGSSYTWHDSDSAVLSGTLGLSGKHYYKIVYFIDLRTATAGFNPTSADITYSIRCTQVD